MKKAVFLFGFLFIGLFCDLSLCYAQDESQHLEGFNLVGYGEGGGKAWDLQGSTATIKDSEISIVDVDANSYGQENMNVTSKSGHIDKQSGNMRLEKDVVVTTETGTKMLTDSLVWQKEKDLVSTEDDVTILRENMKAVGKGMTAQPGQSKAQLDKEVKVEYKPTADSTMKEEVMITCDGPMEVDYKAQTAVFNDNVVAIRGDQRLAADKMNLFFDPEKKQIKKMVCIGNVTITQGENVSHSDEAIYESESQKITLVGRPKLLLYMNEDKDKNGEKKNVPFGS